MTTLIETKKLTKHFPVRRGVFSRVSGWVRAVDGVSLRVGCGETLGLVGESGCGKSTLGRAILGLVEPTSGTVRFDGRDVTALRGAAMRKLRQKMQIIFQDPYGSLDPRMTVGAIVAEGLVIHRIGTHGERRDRMAALLEEVGIDPASAGRYPHEFSGGQRQRIGIARALAAGPRFVVCDEAVSALDVSVQGQVLNLLSDIQEKHGLSYLFISHDLSVVRHISDRVAVMYLGRIVELAPSDELYCSPAHPYTRALLSAIPVPEAGQKQRREALDGDVPSPINPPPGCPFHPRCKYKTEECTRTVPILKEIGPNHKVACNLQNSIKNPSSKAPGFKPGDTERKK
jgi:oligopeptide/dipeptide ABC transporter ATP-binding protein